MTGLLPYLRLVRAGTLFSPGCDVVAGMCVLGLPWSGDAARMIGASVLLYASGMVWNDVADLREDRVQRPERPIPRGDIPLPLAAVLAAGLMGAALLLSPDGWRLHHGILAALILCYDFLTKRVVWLGALNMGALRCLNLLTAAAPLWLAADAPGEVPSELVTAGACYGVYIIAVTILGTFEDQPTVRDRAVVTVQAAPLLAALIGVFAVQQGFWPAPLLAALPVLALARRNRLVTTWDQPAIRKSMMYLLLGTMLYTALLCVASSRWLEALGIALCIPLARRIARTISLT